MSGGDLTGVIIMMDARGEFEVDSTSYVFDRKGGEKPTIKMLRIDIDGRRIGEDDKIDPKQLPQKLKGIFYTFCAWDAPMVKLTEAV